MPGAVLQRRSRSWRRDLERVYHRAQPQVAVALTFLVSCALGMAAVIAVLRGVIGQS
jgi:hypothetical protein